MPEFMYYPNLGITTAYALADAGGVGYWVDWGGGTATVEAWHGGTRTWSATRVF